MGDTYFLIFGIVVAALGALLAWVKIKVLISCRTPVNAEICRIKNESTKIRGSTVHSYRPVYLYSFGGKEYKAEAPFSSVREKKYNIGDCMQILICEKNPDLYCFRGRLGMLFAGLIIFAIGMVFVVAYFL